LCTHYDSSRNALRAVMVDHVLRPSAQLSDDVASVGRAATPETASARGPCGPDLWIGVSPRSRDAGGADDRLLFPRSRDRLVTIEAPDRGMLAP